jgi:hypothetical protein
MAGAFGFEKGDHYQVSVKCGERVLLPAVREAAPDTLVITNGFSCHEQILQQSGRQALHLAQVLSLAQTTGKQRAKRAPEPARKEFNLDSNGEHPAVNRPRAGIIFATTGLVLAGAIGAAWLGNKRKG